MMTDLHGTDRAALDRQTLARLGNVMRGFATSPVGGRAIALGGALLTLLLAINALNVVNSYVGRDFMTAIEKRDGHGFIVQALRYAGVFAAATLAAVVYRFTEERLGLLWREWFTGRLTAIYLDRQFYYHLNAAGRLANPDQRIADDVRAFTTTTLSLALIFLNGTFTMIAFAGVLWSISRMLFATAVAYAVLGSAVAYAIGRPLVRLNYDQSDREADFRAQLVYVRNNAESIALLGGEPQLLRRLAAQIGALIANGRRIIAVNRNLGLFSTGYNYMIQLIPALVVAPLFMRGAAEFGVIPQSSMAFAQLIGAFSLVINQFPQLSSYAAVLARLNALGEAYQTLSAPQASALTVVDDDTRLAFERCTLLAPHNQQPLVRDLSLALPAGARVLMTGDGQVTGALLRALAGLWRDGSGRIVRPSRAALQILPERPYLPPGTLRELLAPDTTPAALGEARIVDTLRGLGVETAMQRAGGLDVERDWHSVLTLDEQRLVSAAHLLLAAPRLAVLADPVASLGAERTAALLAALQRNGSGYLVLGGGAIAPAPFETVVSIAADGTWTRTDTAGAAAVASSASAAPRSA
jgi:putative ATP-binding cassette transporter